MYYKIYIAVALLLLGPRLHAADSRTVTLQSVPEVVRSSNPQLAAARFRIAEAKGRLKGAGRLANPSLEIGAKHDARVRERGFEVAFSQAFPVTDRLQREKDVSAAEVRVAEAEVDEVARLLIAQARVAVVEVLAARELKVMRKKESDLADELANFIEDIAAKGEGSILDAGQARLSSVQHSLEIRQLGVREKMAMGQLRSLIGLGSNSSIEVRGTLPVPYVPKSERVEAEKRPDYRAAVLSSEVAEREVELEKSKRKEDIEATVFVESERAEDAPDGLERDGMIGFRISIPLPFWNKNEGAIEEKSAKKERTKKEAEALAVGIQNEVTTARELMNAHAQVISEIDRDLLPLAQQQVELSEKIYREGQGDLQAVLRARDQQIELQTARLDALREFHLASAAYEAAAGK